MYRVLIWGIGEIAEKLESDGINAEIIGYIQTEKGQETHKGKKVYSVDEIPQDYDFIIVANRFENEIYRECVKLEINLSKIIFLKPVDTFMGNGQRDIRMDVLGEETALKWLDADMLDENQTFFARDMALYRKLNTRANFKIQEEYVRPYIRDKFSNAGSLNGYLWMDLWAARLIHSSGVKSHFDIGSRIDGFVTHLLSMEVEVTLIDVREYPGKIRGLHFIQDDATSLHQIRDGSIESMSALCSPEHFGLGRFGDPIDPEGCFKAFASMQKKMLSGGNLYICVPIGKERLEFNSRRVFYASTVIESFKDMELVEFSCAWQDRIEKNVTDIHKYDDYFDKSVSLDGLFHFIKR